MPSPFPGMDPYLEAPDIWPDLHDGLAGEIRAELNRELPAPYYARLEMRHEVGVMGIPGETRRVVPDITVAHHVSDVQTSTALAEPRTEIMEGVEITIFEDPVRHQYVEIRDPSRGHHLVTLIEIASPANKHPGPDREKYISKQRWILESDANLIELDLLRTGTRLTDSVEILQFLDSYETAPDYLISINRSWKREGGELSYEMFPLSVRQSLPCIPVPLQKDETEIGLDLQWVFEQTYDRGPYARGAVDYSKQPVPELREEDQEWMERTLGDRGIR